jgi:tetratricopeptide (TPR) repeat protein
VRLRAFAILLLALALLPAGCAYFNTFYHAQQSYKKALKVQAESKSEKLSPAAIGHYDAAIKKCAKVIFDHGGGWNAGIDDALFLMGACYYGKREYDTAIKKFNELLLHYSKSDHAPEALFYTGLCYSKMRNHATAKRIFDRVLRAYPDFERRDEILMTAAEGLEMGGEQQAAIRQYREVITRYRKSAQREKALERLGDIQFENGRYDSALIAYQELAHTTRDDDLYFEAQLRAGACLVRQGRVDEATDIYGKILPENPDKNENGGRVWLAWAEAENRRGRHDEALEHLERVSEAFENRNLGLEADFRRGYTYEVHLQAYDEARTAYEKASRAGVRSLFKDQASSRLKNLKHLQDLQSSVAETTSDTRRRAEAALKMAEFSYYEGDDPGRALTQYEVVVQEYPGTESALRAAFARGWILRTEFDSLDAAAMAFADLIERDPSSPQAEGSLALLSELPLPTDRRADLAARVEQARARRRAQADSAAAVAAAAQADSMARADTLAAPLVSLPSPADSVSAAARAAPAAFDSATAATHIGPAAFDSASAAAPVRTPAVDSLAPPPRSGPPLDALRRARPWATDTAGSVGVVTRDSVDAPELPADSSAAAEQNAPPDLPHVETEPEPR